MYQTSFSTTVSPMQSKRPKLTKFKDILHKHFFQMSWWFFSHILIPAEDNSESKTGKVITLYLHRIQVHKLYSQTVIKATLSLYPLYKEHTQKKHTKSWLHNIYSSSIAWSGYGYRTRENERALSSAFSRQKKGLKVQYMYRDATCSYTYWD